MFITEENHCISCYIFLHKTARLWWCPLYITTPSYIWPWASSVRKRISDLFFWDKDTRHRTLNYCDTIHCINAIILIIIVILSPPREAHHPDLPPFAHIFLITLRVAYISYFRGLELACLPAPPTSHTLLLYPSTFPLPFPFPNYTARNLEIPPWLLVSP